MKEPLRHTITCIHKVSASRLFPVKLSHTHFSSLLFLFFSLPVVKPSLDLVHAGKEFKNNACKVLTMFFWQQQHSRQWTDLRRWCALDPPKELWPLEFNAGVKKRKSRAACVRVQWAWIPVGEKRVRPLVCRCDKHETRGVRIRRLTSELLPQRLKVSDVLAVELHVRSSRLVPGHPGAGERVMKCECICCVCAFVRAQNRNLESDDAIQNTNFLYADCLKLSTPDLKTNLNCLR